MKHAELTKPEIRLSTIQQLAKGGRWRTEAMRSHSSDLLLWFTCGQGRITIAGVTRGYGAHNAIFIPAGTMHGFETSAKVFGTAVFLPPSPGIAMPDSPLHLRIRDNTAQNELSALLQDMQAEATSDRPLRDTALLHLSGLLGIWLARQAEAAKGEEAKKPDRGEILVRRFTEMIERHLTSGRSVAEYAAELGVTPTHLSRVCNKACGRPASALLADRLIYEARRQLSETRDPINVIARRLGYGSPAYFTRAFQHHTGLTPSAFRKAG